MIPFDEVRAKLMKAGCGYFEQQMFANDEDCRLAAFEFNGKRAILRSPPGHPVTRNDVRSLCNRLGINPATAGFDLRDPSLN
jgi:hypothetical protein